MNSVTKIVLLVVNLKLLQDYSSAYYNEEITSEINSKKVESFFVSHILSNTTNDPVCSLSEEKKRALCKQIFQLPLFKNRDVHYNTAAFFVNKLLCQQNPVKFTSFTFFIDETIEQKMYPCHGRHYPVGTDYKTDTHYDKFYVATGLYENSVIVYIHKYDIDSDWYSVFSYHEKVRLSELKDFIINVKDVRAELEFNQFIRSTNDRKLLEYIYIRGNDKNDKEDSTVCKLDIPRKATLCEIIFNRYRYETYFSKLNKQIFAQFKDLTCKRQRVKIVYSERYRNIISEQYMYPCFSKNRLTLSHELKERNIENFYVSEGSWKNSIFIYYHPKMLNDEQFLLFELLENVCIDCLKPSNITEEDIRKESLDTYLEIQKINFGLQAVKNRMSDKIKVITSNAMKNLTLRQMAVLSTYRSHSREEILRNTQLINLDIGGTIVAIIYEEEKLKFLSYSTKYKIRMVTDIELLNRISTKYSAEIFYIDQRDKKIKTEKLDDVTFNF